MLKLYPSRSKYFLLLVASIAFTAGGIFIIQDGKNVGWFVSIFFGLGIPVSLLSMLPQSTFLKIDNEGFQYSSLFRKHSFKWSDIDQFGVGKIASNKMVMFNFSERYLGQRTARKVSSAISGAEGALPDTYGKKAKELAALLNQYKNEYT